MIPRALIIRIALIGVLIGFATGFAAAWRLQGFRLLALHSTFDEFIIATRDAANDAQREADRRAEDDQKAKGAADEKYRTQIDALHATVQRLRDARTGSDFVPTAPAGTGSPDLTCFDRAELERALRTFDSGVSQLVDEGSADALGLTVAREWVARPASP